MVKFLEVEDDKVLWHNNVFKTKITHIELELKNKTENAKKEKKMKESTNKLEHAISVEKILGTKLK